MQLSPKMEARRRRQEAKFHGGFEVMYPGIPGYVPMCRDKTCCWRFVKYEAEGAEAEMPTCHCGGQKWTWVKMKASDQDVANAESPNKRRHPQ